MPSNGVHVLEVHETPSLVSIHPERTEPLFDLPSRHDIAKEELRATITKIYAPVMRVLQVFGAYFGSTSFYNLANSPGRLKKNFYMSRCYCGVVAVCLWLNFTALVVSLCFEGVSSAGTFFLLLTFLVWCLTTALNNTICLLVLPVTETNKTRFGNFIRRLLCSSCDLRSIESKSRKGVLISALFLGTATINTILVYKIAGAGVGTFKPWNKWQVIEVVSLIITDLSLGAWVIPDLLFCITCEVLVKLFNDLYKDVSSQRSMFIDISRIIKEHRKLCEIVDLADKVFSPILLATMAFYLPLICFTFYLTVVSSLSKEKGSIFILANVYFLLVAAAKITLFMVFGAKVNAKIHSLTSILEDFDVSSSDEIKLLKFMTRLQGEPMGLSIGGLVVITKALSLTIVGVIVSYFAVLLSLPS